MSADMRRGKPWLSQLRPVAGIMPFRSNSRANRPEATARVNIKGKLKFKSLPASLPAMSRQRPVCRYADKRLFRSMDISEPVLILPGLIAPAFFSVCLCTRLGCRLRFGCRCRRLSQVLGVFVLLIHALTGALDLCSRWPER